MEILAGFLRLTSMSLRKTSYLNLQRRKKNLALYSCVARRFAVVGTCQMTQTFAPETHHYFPYS